MFIHTYYIYIHYPSKKTWIEGKQEIEYKYYVKHIKNV